MLDVDAGVAFCFTSGSFLITHYYKNVQWSGAEAEALLVLRSPQDLMLLFDEVGEMNFVNCLRSSLYLLLVLEHYL